MFDEATLAQIHAKMHGLVSADLSTTAVIGDSLRDLQAAEAVGAKPILVKTGKGQQTLLNNPQLNIPVFENLYEAAQHLIT